MCNLCLIISVDVGVLEDDKFKVEFDYEFAESVFEHSRRNFYKSGEKPVLYNNLTLIIKTVMEYENDDTNSK